MQILFSPPSLDDLIRLLRAWRLWALGAMLGAAIGAVVYFVVPPPYQTRATVVVDFNLEEAWPQDTDRQHFYYLERETRKLEEIAWSDDLMEGLSAEFGISVEELRGGVLDLSQPAEGGWHFYAMDQDADMAERLASAWANAFAEHVTAIIGAADGLNSFIEVTVIQSENLPVERSVPLSSYLFIGAMGFLAISTLGILLFKKPE
jgi:capsular polysaccharide biosynthesis protein